MLVEDHHYGKPISKKLSEYLRTYTDGSDRANVCMETNVGTSTIRDVVHRTNTLTKRNSKAIIALMRVAVRNCTLKIERAEEAKGELESMLKIEKTGYGK